MAKYRKREDAYYYSEKEQEKGSAVNTALLVGGLLAGGYLFWRTGLLKASVQKTMVLSSKYKPGPVARAIEGVYQWEHYVTKGQGQNLSALGKASELKRYVVSAVKNKHGTQKPHFYLEEILRQSRDVLDDLKSSWGAQHGVTQTAIDQGVDVVKAKIVEQIQKRLTPNAKLQSMMQKVAGVRYAVLDDIMQLNVPEFARLKQLAKIYGLSGGNIIVDPALFINEAGELIDMRGMSEQLTKFIQRLEKDIQIPIVNFNPLGLLHLSDVLGINRSPFTYLFDVTERQPLLTGNIDELGRQLLFIGGEVFDVGNIPQKLDDLVKVNKGLGYLIHGLGNVKLQYIRTMAGLEMNEYTKRGGVRGLLDPLFRALDIGYQDTFLWDDPRLGFLGRKEAENPLFEAMEAGIGKIIDALGPERASHIPPATKRFIEQPWVYVNAADFSSLGSIWKQLTAGRHRLQDVSTLTLIPYIGVGRMDLSLGKARLGLSSKHTGDTLSLFTNLFLRRALVLGGLAFGWHYLNYEMEKLTGVRPEFLLADAYRYTMTALSRLSSAIGLTGFMDRLQQLTPGSDQILELPIVKDATIWMTKTPEEMEEWFESGEEPVRKGRYWPLGNTPFTGGRIQAWRPNWYRRLKSKWKYTDVLYGSEDEYFAHAPIPTPRYPTAPIKRYVTDRYWLEEKHYYERPYLYTGDYPELVELPIIGPLLTAVSRLIKPRKKMHPEVWAQLEGRPEGELPEGEYLVVEPPASGGAAAGPSGGYGAVGGLEGAAGQPEGTAERHETAGEPEEETTEGGYITSGGVRVEITPEGDIVDEYGRKYTAPGSARDVARAFWSSVTEVAGFYGFLAETATGISQDVPKDKEVRIAEARGIYSIRRRFWEENLGGLGGNVNEIVRRFIGRREKWGEMFNPVPNRMPSWLPRDYYIDFHTGDSYLPHGEMLLPGGGYEALYNKDFTRFLKEHPEIIELHKKGVINRYELYGPLDRFRILAHVAPYSKEYKEYSKLMSKIKLTPEQKEEVKRIREMVRKMKEPLRIYPYRFVGAERELKKRVVTVESLADNNTIFVKELPNIPIKFAGIHVAGAKDDKAAQRAAELLQSKLKPGTKIVIYYEPDDERKARKDYSPIKAVVYVKGENINRLLLKEKVAKEKEKDYSPAAVMARFSRLERAFGKAWERFCVSENQLIVTHDDLKQAKEVKLGDLVLTTDGNWHKVVCVHKRPLAESEKVYRIRTWMTSDALVLTGNHEVYAAKAQSCPFVKGSNGCRPGVCAPGRSICRDGCPAAYKPTWIKAEELRKDDWVCMPIAKLPKRRVFDLVDYIDLSNKVVIDDKIYLKVGGFNPNAIRKSSVPVDRYIPVSRELYTLFGYYLSEGHIKLQRGKPVAVQFAFHINETEYANEVIECARKVFGVSCTVHYQPSCNVQIVHLGNSIVTEFFNALLGRTVDKRLSTEALTDDLEALKGLVVGYFRGDGHIGETVSCVSVQPNIIIPMRMVLLNLGFIPGLHIAEARKDVSGTIHKKRYMLHIGGKQGRELAKLLGKEIPSSKRETNGWAFIQDGVLFARIKEVEEVKYEGKLVYDFTVEDNHSYTTLVCAVHNSHLDTPIHTKFLQVRSAYEDWVRREVYGKNFQSWEHPIRDFLIPTYQSFISKPLPIAMLLGAGIGALFGRRPATRVIGAAIGAATVGAGALYTTAYQVVTGKKWIPARRRREWELEQYVDILKYVKYRRLYEHERKRALEEEGFDVQKYFEARDKHKELVKARKRALMEAKRAIQKLKGNQTDELFEILRKYNIRLAVEDDKKKARKAVKRTEQETAALEIKQANELARAQAEEADEKEKAKRVQRSLDELKKLAIKSINAELASLKTSPEVSEEDLPPRARRAIAYYRQMKQTMYGYEPGEPLGDFIVALPKKERRYFRYFLKMPKWEYKKLKKVAPEWLFYGLAPAHGDKAPKKPKLEEYFKTHYLPDESWEGWRPDVDLEAVRVKLVDKMHLDPGEFDIWEEDKLRAQQVPVRVPKMNMRTPGNAGEIAERLRRLLSAAGVEDIDVNVEPSDKAGIEVNMHMGYDMSRDLVEYINRDPAMLLAD